MKKEEKEEKATSWHGESKVEGTRGNEGRDVNQPMAPAQNLCNDGVVKQDLRQGYARLMCSNLTTNWTAGDGTNQEDRHKLGDWRF